MNTVIIANGELEASARLRGLWSNADLRIAADGGANQARAQFDQPPHVLIGDLDSADEAAQHWCTAGGAEVIRFQREKAKTDLELALEEAIKRHATEITLIGTLGGRFDQMIANVMLLVKASESNVPTRLAGDRFDAWLAGPRTPIEGSPGDTVSLIPLSARVDGIATTGLRYPLRGETLFMGAARGVSNELTETHAEVTLISGLLLVVHLLA
ncbi:MAG: thiamine diphosphokinase [Chloroflexi bacterium]|nr:thiamine diphosphokinase [Chloroflexota bacterium]